MIEFPFKENHDYVIKYADGSLDYVTYCEYRFYSNKTSDVVTLDIVEYVDVEDFKFKKCYDNSWGEHIARCNKTIHHDYVKWTGRNYLELFVFVEGDILRDEEDPTTIISLRDGVSLKTDIYFIRHSATDIEVLSEEEFNARYNKL